MKAFTVIALALAMVAPVFADYNPANPTQTKKGVEEPSASPTPDAQIVQGCFSSAGSLVKNGTLQWNSKSSCAHDTCYASGFKVAGTTQGKICYCGNSLPPESDRVDDSQCNTECAGFGWDACGGATTWTIYNTGVSLVVDQDESDSVSSSSSSSTATQAPTQAVVTISGSTVVITASSSPTSQPTGSSANVAGIAAGVVVGVVALAGLSGLAFFLIRRRRNLEIEEEHRRNAAVNAFINGSKPPGSSGGLSVSDSRLDPVMAQRRMSSGSIADNQDYTRRILRVTNA